MKCSREKFFFPPTVPLGATEALHKSNLINPRWKKLSRLLSACAWLVNLLVSAATCEYIQLMIGIGFDFLIYISLAKYLGAFGIREKLSQTGFSEFSQTLSLCGHTGNTKPRSRASTC